MLRGSYASGSLAVTARCPCRRSGPSANPACPRPGSRPARDASRSRFGCCDSLSNAPAIRGCATPLRVQVSRCIAVDAPRRAVPLRCLAFQILRRSNLRRALPSPGPAPQSNAFAARISPSPSHAAALLRRCLRCFAPQCRSRSWHLMAELPNASAHRFVASPSRGRSLLCSSLAMTSFAALVHSFAAQRHSKPSHAAHGIALPSPRSTPQCLSFADLGSAVHFHRLAEQIKALPSPHRANQSVSFANPRNAFPSQLPA